MECMTKSVHSYEATINTLNKFQSPGKNIRGINKIQLMNECFLRCGMSFETLDKLSVIHVTGTKGKGTTCAYTESILRQHGFKTGFFSSPHLISVTERIKVNNIPIDQNKFAHVFWELHDKLQESDAENMPTYFQFLLLIALKVFIEEEVDVALIEVGIGGEYDSTNFLRIVQIAAITSLGYDHISALGNTLESIAWHKSGIMKKGAKVFTSPQPAEAMKVLKERSIEKECNLEVVELVNNNLILDCVSPPLNVNGLNASLSVKFAHTWLTINGKQVSLENTRKGLSNCYWPGRFQILHTNKVIFYLDGAHTNESIQHCTNWFREATKDSQNKKALMFNNTGARSSENHLRILKDCDFDLVCFVPNVATEVKSADNAYLEKSMSEFLERCENHKNIWMELTKDEQNKNHQEVIVASTISSMLKTLPDNVKYDLLVTGSLHLIGETLSLIDPTLNGN